MELKPLDALVLCGKNRPPHRLDDNPIVLKHSLHLCHKRATLIRVGQGGRLVNQRIEFGVVVFRLVPDSPLR